MTEIADVTITGDDKNATIKGSGILDLTNSQRLREALSHSSKTAETVDVDLRSAAFIDTAILEYLARAGREMMRRGKRLKVTVKEGSHPQRVLRIAGFVSLMDIVAEPASAE